MTGPPASALVLAAKNSRARRELRAGARARGTRRPTVAGAVADADAAERRAAPSLTLSNDAVWVRERARATGGGVRAPRVLRAPYYLLCWLFDEAFDRGRRAALVPRDGRADALPLVRPPRPPRASARATRDRRASRRKPGPPPPPLAQVRVEFHLYESLGWRRRRPRRARVHFAGMERVSPLLVMERASASASVGDEAEASPLEVMESPGGDQRWSDRRAALRGALLLGRGRG